MGMLMPLEVGSACGKFELISAFSLLMPKLPWVLSIDLGPVDLRKFPEGPAGLFLWKEHSFFSEVEHSRQSSPVFQTHEPSDLAFRFHCSTVVGPLGVPHSLFALVYHIGDCKARRVAKRQLLLFFLLLLLAGSVP